MKRLHIHIAVDNLEQSTQFYSTLFGMQPTKQKEQYAKWMLEDPRVNFAISARGTDRGLDHLGIQVEDDQELTDIRERLAKADLNLFDEGETTCCYAKSDKSWVQDPSGIAWEAYRNMADVELFSERVVNEAGTADKKTCCASKQPEQSIAQPATEKGSGCC